HRFDDPPKREIEQYLEDPVWLTMILELETNIFEGDISGPIICKYLSVKLPSLDSVENQGEFIRGLYRAIRRRTAAYNFGDRVYFLGEKENLISDLRSV